MISAAHFVRTRVWCLRMVAGGGFGLAGIDHQEERHIQQAHLGKTIQTRSGNAGGVGYRAMGRWKPKRREPHGGTARIGVVPSPLYTNINTAH